MNYNGAMAERAAAAYLRKHGYKLLDYNYYTKFGEIDLIFRKRKEIIFVEVKARDVKDGLPPRVYVDYAKQQKIRLASQSYIKMHNLLHLQPRFDICEVYTENNAIKSVNHLENAFQFD